MITGLDQMPQFLSDTMKPSVDPDLTAEVSVLANGGLDPCKYEVITNNCHNFSCREGMRAN